MLPFHLFIFKGMAKKLISYKLPKVALTAH